MGALATPGFSRKPLRHTVKSYANTVPSVHAFDDELEFNTQCSSQWDSLCHYHHQNTATAYNGVKPTVDELTQAYGNEDETMEIPTLNHWHKRGGLVARGVLLDYKAWADENEVHYDVFQSHRISTEELEMVAKSQGVVFKTGDVLIVRTGFTEALTGKTGEQQQQLLSTGRRCGVEGSMKSARWIWNHHFSAVAGDTSGFEAVPPLRPDGTEGNSSQLVLHQYLLSLFGMPIGEFWDLKALSDTCRELKRYTFLLTSSPLNVAGSIASPPNALALF